MRVLTRYGGWEESGRDICYNVSDFVRKITEA